jgi:hypothetical protein
MPAAEVQSPWASAGRRPHFFKVLIGDYEKRMVSEQSVAAILVFRMHEVKACLTALIREHAPIDQK